MCLKPSDVVLSTTGAICRRLYSEGSREPVGGRLASWAAGTVTWEANVSSSRCPGPGGSYLDSSRQSEGGGRPAGRDEGILEHFRLSSF